MKRRFVQCDVFSRVPGRGNGLAVVVEAEGLSPQAMQSFAAWTNLAETTFLLPPEDPRADYKVRIFTPVREMPFAGHPTLGSCMTWLHAGGSPRESGIVRQECPIGIVEIDVTGEEPAFTAPPTKIEPLGDEALATIADALEVPRERILRTALLDNGPVWQVLELADAQDVLAVDATKVRWPEHSPVGLIGAHAPGGECAYEVRMLAPSSGMNEDPITGSLNAALARWMLAEGRLTQAVTVAQGTAIGRLGRVRITPRGGDVLIGGAVTIMIDGMLDL